MYYAFDSGTMLRALTLPDDDENDDNEYKHNRTDSPEREEACDQVLDMESSVLELALEEFPSCALLRLYHFDTVCGVQLRLQSRSSSVDPNATRSIEDGWRRVDGAFEEAIRAVGNGSHWNEDYLVVAFYNTYIRLLLHKTTTATTTTVSSKETTKHQKVLELFVRRAQTPHMSNGANDSILQDMQSISSLLTFTPAEYDQVQDARRTTCTTTDYTTCLANTLEKESSARYNN